MAIASSVVNEVIVFAYGELSLSFKALRKPHIVKKLR